LILIKTPFGGASYPGHQGRGLGMLVTLLIIILAVIVAVGLAGLGVWFIGHELQLEEDREMAEL
jgi:flagellar basal body-associated protein FliL